MFEDLIIRPSNACLRGNTAPQCAVCLALLGALRLKTPRRKFSEAKLLDGQGM